MEQELDKLIDHEDVTGDALERVEKLGIIFLDEIDKIAGERGPTGGGGPDVSREACSAISCRSSRARTSRPSTAW